MDCFGSELLFKMT